MNDPILGSPEEMLAFEKEWYSGQLLTHADRLMHFVQNRRDEILAMAGGPSATEDALIRAVQQLIAQQGSVDMPSELRDQRREIDNEIWYRGQRGDFNRRKTQEEWTVLYAEDWRRWRIKQYQFVAAHCGDRLAWELRNGGDTLKAQ